MDHDAHEFGPNDPKVKASVEFVDHSIQQLEEALKPLNLPINFIFVSDHGMKEVDNNNTMGLPKEIDPESFKVPFGDALLQLYAKDKTKISSTYNALKKNPDFDTYLISETPKRWHFSSSDDRFNRLGDILLVPKLPRVFNLGKNKTSLGKHGFDNTLPEMRASFLAWGPAFKPGSQIKPFENVHIYPLIAHILGLHYDPKSIDGKLKKVKKK